VHVLSYLVLKQLYVAQVSKIAGAVLKFSCCDKFQQMWNSPDAIRTISSGADFGLFTAASRGRKLMFYFSSKKSPTV